MGKLTTLCRKRAQRNYTLAFKLSVVEQVEKGKVVFRLALEMLRPYKAEVACGLIASVRCVLTWARDCQRQRQELPSKHQDILFFNQSSMDVKF